MDKIKPKASLGIVVALGAVWGLSEAGLGMGLRSCAAFVSGALMTGVALFFMAAAWVVSRKIYSVVLLVIVAALFKLFDAFLLSLPLTHGAIGNPIFAFFMEGLAFLFILALLKNSLSQKAYGQALLGGTSALVAANLFPLVRFATGVPACVVAGTGYPLSLYYVYIAVAVSMLTVPLGYWVGARISTFETQIAGVRWAHKFNFILSPAALLLCLVLLALMRLT